MGFQDEPDVERRQTSDKGGVAKAGARKVPGKSGEVGDALRTVYQRTIDEAIPPEMLDLLGKLG